MLALVPDWSDRAIAKHVGVSHPFVAAERRSLVTVTSEESAERTYTTKHGTQATMDTSGQKAARQKSRTAIGVESDSTQGSLPAAKPPFK